MNKYENNGSVHNIFCCPKCNTCIKKNISKSYQKNNEYSSDGVKEQRYFMDYLRTPLPTELLATMNHISKRQPKLAQYLILDSNPILVNLDDSNRLSRSPHSIGKTICSTL